MMRHSPTPSAAIALATTTILISACSDGSEPRASDDESSSPSSASADLVQANRVADFAGDTPLTPGRYALDVSSDQPDAPMVLVDVPAGYTGSGDGYEIVAVDEDGDAFRHFGTWTVAEIARQPCGGAEWVDPGPTVGDLAEALRALPVWESTRPAARTIGGYEGVFMELNVPARIPAKCGGELLSWRDHLGGTQGIGRGKTQRLWILDVDGHRVMLIAGYFPDRSGPTEKQVDQLTQMAEGASFVDADQVAP